MNEEARPSELETLLVRPPEQRIREFQYRFAQAMVFGLPVIFLQYVGPSLGGPESDKWIGLLQALLSGWATYVGAAGMLFEGMILLSRRKPTLDGLVALSAIGMYFFSAISVFGIIFRGALFYRPLLFHVVIIVLIAWTGYRWWRLSHASPATK